MSHQYDAIVIGGGFYGLRVALHLRRACNFSSVLVLEKEPVLMNRASYINQARVHNGYHYPRSILTAYRSRVNGPSFLAEYSAAIVDDFEHLYAVATRGSKVNARQFVTFCKRVGAFVEPAATALSREFNPMMVEKVFRVHEPAFDARILRDITLDSISEVGGVEILTGEEAVALERTQAGIRVRHSSADSTAGTVINATYSNINALRHQARLPYIPVQHELTEMALVDVGSPFNELGVTVMDGPFFSLMPFPSRKLHSLSHVRYTPHARWQDTAEALESQHPSFPRANTTSNYAAMYADVIRYIPGLRSMRHKDSVWEVKTVLATSSVDDSRPIVFRHDADLPGFSTIMGGKIDNVYDVLEELSELYG